MDLSPYRWRNRLLLVFASPASGQEYEKQRRLLKGSEPGFEDRDLLLGEFPGRETGRLNGTPIPAVDERKLRDGFGVRDDGFVVLLVGKDGGEKFRSGSPVPAQEVFRRVDAMPMRRREMGGRG